MKRQEEERITVGRLVETELQGVPKDWEIMFAGTIDGRPLQFSHTKVRGKKLIQIVLHEFDGHDASEPNSSEPDDH